MSFTRAVYTACVHMHTPTARTLVCGVLPQLPSRHADTHTPTTHTRRRIIARALTGKPTHASHAGHERRSGRADARTDGWTDGRAGGRTHARIHARTRTPRTHAPTHELTHQSFVSSCCRHLYPNTAGHCVSGDLLIGAQRSSTLCRVLGWHAPARYAPATPRGRAQPTVDS